MPKTTFDALPDHGRLWVFPASRSLEPAERDALLAEVDDFLEGWAAHGAPLHAARELREGRFLLVGVDVDAAQPSGCSIDALVNRLRGLGERLGVGLIEHGPVWYRAQGEIASVTRAGFKERVAAGDVTPDTPVVDTTLTRVAQLRGGELERPARESWHAPRRRARKRAISSSPQNRAFHGAPSRKPTWPPVSVTTSTSQGFSDMASRGSASRGRKGSSRLWRRRVGTRMAGRNVELEHAW